MRGKNREKILVRGQDQLLDWFMDGNSKNLVQLSKESNSVATATNLKLGFLEDIVALQRRLASPIPGRP